MPAPARKSRCLRRASADGGVEASKASMTDAADYRFEEDAPIPEKHSVLTGKYSFDSIGKVPTCEAS